MIQRSLILLLVLSGCASREPGPVSSPTEQSRAKVRFDRAVLLSALDAIESWHRSHGTQWRPEPGLRRDAIEAEFAGLSFVVPEELLLIWGRADGDTAEVPFVGAHILLSCRRARAAYDSLRADDSVPWRHNWIPVLRDREAWIAVDASRRAAPAGPLVTWSTDPPRVASTNLTRYLQTWAEAAELGLWEWSDQPEFATQALLRLHRTHNDDLPGPWSDAQVPGHR